MSDRQEVNVKFNIHGLLYRNDPEDVELIKWFEKQVANQPERKRKHTETLRQIFRDLRQFQANARKGRANGGGK